MEFLQYKTKEEYTKVWYRDRSYFSRSTLKVYCYDFYAPISSSSDSIFYMI